MSQLRRNNSSPRHGHRGFSLIELLAVTVLLGILATLAAVSVRAHVDHARVAAAWDQLAAADRAARHWALRHQQPALLTIDVRKGIIVRQTAEGPGPRLQLSRGVHIDQVVVGSEKTQRGTLQVVVTPQGQSSSYALQLTTRGGAKRWFVVLGSTGQCLDQWGAELAASLN